MLEKQVAELDNAAFSQFRAWFLEFERLPFDIRKLADNILIGDYLLWGAV
jgi:hypothetical protein